MFILALSAFSAIGMTYSVGECVNLGILKEFLPNYLVGFSSGTASARIVAAVLWLIIRAFNGDEKFVWAAMTLTSLIYFFAFCYIQRQIKSGVLGNPCVELTVFFANTEFSAGISPKTGNAYFSFAQLKAIFHNSKYLALVLSFTYFFEALISVGFADRISLRIEKDHGDNVLKKNHYEFMQFCYYVGIMIGKSFVNLIKIERFWILLLLQLANFLVFVFEVVFMVLQYWVDFIIVFWVGIIGGLCFSNVFFIQLKNEEIPKYFKEASSNFILVSANFAVLIASISIIFIDNYWLKS